MKKNDEAQTLAEIEKRLELVRKLVRKYVRPGRCLSEELIRERRLAAQNEQWDADTP